MFSNALPEAATLPPPWRISLVELSKSDLSQEDKRSFSAKGTDLEESLTVTTLEEPQFILG